MSRDVGRGVVLASVAVVMLGTGCSTVPHSMGLGQLATPLSPGQVELGLGTGVSYEGTTPPTRTPGASTGSTSSFSVSSNSGTNRGNALSFPRPEANMDFGITDGLGLNLHLSEAGLQPGVKIAMSHGTGFDVAVLPEVAVSYSYNSSLESVSISSASSPAASNGTSTGSALGIMVGVKLLISSPSGLFGGIGYDYQRETSSTSATMISALGGTTTITTSLTTEVHNLSAGVGCAMAMGAVSLRPEVDILLSPNFGETLSVTGGSSTAATGGTFWVIYPNVTVALRSPGPKSSAPVEVAPAPSQSAPPPALPALPTAPL